MVDIKYSRRLEKKGKVVNGAIVEREEE